MDTAPKTFADPATLLNPTPEGKIRGACHCGTVQFEVALTDGLNTARRCTCSYCRMRGAIAVSAQLGGLTILSGEDSLSRYSFHTSTARHFFCSRCGIYTHHQRRSNPNQYGINVACLEYHPTKRGHPSDKDARRNKELEHFSTASADSKRSENALENLTPFAFAQVPVLDGVAHPSDKGPAAPAQLVGLLRFIPTNP